MSHFKRFAIAAAALGLTATAAIARPAVSETSLNVRSGPGTEYGVIGVLQPGQPVDAGPCSGSWCQVNFSGGSGWASASYLSFGGTVGYAAPPAVVYDDPYYDDYYVSPGFSVGWGVGPRYWWGQRHRHRHGWWRDRDRPGRGDWDRPGRPGRGDWAGRPGGGRQDAGRGPSRPSFSGGGRGPSGNVGMSAGGRGSFGGGGGMGRGGGGGGGNVGGGARGGQDR